MSKRFFVLFFLGLSNGAYLLAGSPKYVAGATGPSQRSVQVLGASSKELNEILRQSSEKAVYYKK